MKALLAVHLLCSIGMFGVIWIVQLVHYPLFDRVELESYPEFQKAHEARISFVVLPMMLGELATGIWLAFDCPAGLKQVWWVGLGLIGLAWATTFFLSVPAHRILANGFDVEAHRRLVLTNWLRTIAWTGHAGVAIYGAFAMLDGHLTETN